ncbi:hypothetical protein [Pandoraea anhela]|uniref:hypothetical protein n=1 Tax=Pandoraea anhela TaxID=2508295 RepID=UPI001240F280|nr:hypothetical protein [Pandoraea anhela]
MALLTKKAASAAFFVRRRLGLRGVRNPIRCHHIRVSAVRFSRGMSALVRAGVCCPDVSASMGLKGQIAVIGIINFNS